MIIYADILTCMTTEQLAIDSTVHSIDASRGNVLYVGGKFSDANSTYQNLVSYDYEIGRFVPLPNDGVNGTVYATLATDAGTTIYRYIDLLSVN